MIDNLVNSYVTVRISYKGNSVFLYLSKHDNCMYLNINSLCDRIITVERWKRRKAVSESINILNKKMQPLKSLFTQKNKGTWICESLCESFGNWYGKMFKKKYNVDYFTDFGTFLKNKLISLYNTFNFNSDPFHSKVDGKHIRAHRTSRFINLTDISNIYKKDLRTWKKTSTYKNYIKEYPDHCLSGNSVTDELGIRTTYGHHDIAIMLLSYYSPRDSPTKECINQFISRLDNLRSHQDQKQPPPYEEESESESDSDYDYEVEDDKEVEKEDEEEKQKIDEKVPNEQNIPHIHTKHLVLKPGYQIESRPKDGYINVTNLCKAGGKQFKAWKRLQKTEAFLRVLSNEVKISTSFLIKRKTGYGSEQGTWVHPQVAINIAQWISPEFAVQVTSWIEDEKQKIDEKVPNNLVNRKLTLKNGETMNIPMREDGYINLTLLCKAGGKRFNHWYDKKETKALIQALECDAGIPASQLIEVKRGNSSKFTQGSWGHPDLAIQLAQWLSPSFAIQVSRWTRELLLTGSVTLGKEKSNKQLEELAKNISIDTVEYEGKSGVYIYEFLPKDGVECNWENAEEEGRKYYGCGVTSDPATRPYKYKKDKKISRAWVREFYDYNTRAEASKAESRIKTIVNDLGIAIKYDTKIECFVANEEELEIIKDEIASHREKSQKYCDDMNLGRLKIESKERVEKYKYKYKYKSDIAVKLFESGKITFEQMKELIRLDSK